MTSERAGTECTVCYHVVAYEIIYLIIYLHFMSGVEGLTPKIPL